MPDFAMMGLFSWILMGLLAGALGRFLLPGRDPMGCVATVLTGIVGAIVGGFVATTLGFGGFQGFDVYSLLLATLGAILFLFVLRLLSGRRKPTKR
ncbi:MAG: GlsB/YeaQ/YmgE family stress response membrane protein [Thermoanaerobaculia bacterium]